MLSFCMVFNLPMVFSKVFLMQFFSCLKTSFMFFASSIESVSSWILDWDSYSCFWSLEIQESCSTDSFCWESRKVRFSKAVCSCKILNSSVKSEIETSSSCTRFCSLTIWSLRTSISSCFACSSSSREGITTAASRGLALGLSSSSKTSLSPPAI